MPEDPVQPVVPPAAVNLEENPFPRGQIVFYCKFCKKLINAERVGKKYLYKCPDCKSKDIAIGTENSIRAYYKIKS